MNGYLNKRMTMSKGRRICPECKGNGYLRTEMNTVVQCLNCWSEGEIDEKIWENIGHRSQITTLYI